MNKETKTSVATWDNHEKLIREAELTIPTIPLRFRFLELSCNSPIKITSINYAPLVYKHHYQHKPFTYMKHFKDE